MNRAQRRKMAKQARSGRGAARSKGPVSRIDDRIAGAARDNVIQIVNQGRSESRALEIAASAFYLTDHLTGRFEAENPLPQPIACQTGCDACCYNQVELTPPEALLIGHHIEKYFSEAAKDLLLGHVARIIQLTAGKGKTEIAARRRSDSLSVAGQAHLLDLSHPAPGVPGHARPGGGALRGGIASRQPRGQQLLRPPPRDRLVGERRRPGGLPGG